MPTRACNESPEHDDQVVGCQRQAIFRLTRTGLVHACDESIDHWFLLGCQLAVAPIEHCPGGKRPKIMVILLQHVALQPSQQTEEQRSLACSICRCK